MKVPFFDSKLHVETIRPEINNAIAHVLDEAVFVNGHWVEEFEEQFAKAYGAKHAISCGNGTDSLYVIMKMLGIGVGDEVITAANGCIADSEAITLTGATPVFVDVEANYYCIDEDIIEEKITPRTKAILAVHLYGQSCNLASIVELCKRKSLLLIEDCAQSHFTMYQNKNVGLFGIASAFSFYPTKNLGAFGDAGCMLTNDDDLAIKLRMYAQHGSLKKNHHLIEGINSRMDSLQAAILLTKLPFIHQWNHQRMVNAEYYNQLLIEVNEIILPKTRPETTHTHHLYVIRAKQRDQLAAFLHKQGVETSIHYPTSLPNLPAYDYLKFLPNDFPVTSVLQNEILSLPIFPGLTKDQILYTSTCIKSFYKR